MEAQTQAKDKRTYMRDYKREQYKLNPEKIQEKNKAYYYMYKYKVSKEELHKYDTLLPNIVRLKKELEDIKSKKPEILKEFLNSYLLEIN